MLAALKYLAGHRIPTPDVKGVFVFESVVYVKQHEA